MNDEKYKILIDTLKKTKEEDIPVSALVINTNDEIIGVGYNNRKKTKNVSGHAEINAMNEALKKLENDNLYGCKIITTLEPCGMCFAAAKQMKINEIDFLLENDKNDLVRSYALNDSTIKLKKIGNNKQTQEYQKMINIFFENIRNKQK